jgi:1-acyl-sn-glycerol-3-phosphate acyltransferase
MRRLLTFGIGLVYLSLCAAQVFLARDIHKQGRIMRRWAARILKAAGIPWTARGLEHLEGLPPCIIVSNHLSSVDIPFLFAVLPRTFRMVAKAELKRVPLIGWVLRWGRFVTVHRHEHHKAMREMEGVEWLFSHGADLYMAAEGTRSRDGRMLPFKKGPFVLSIQHGVPILPVTLAGTDRVMPRKTLSPRAGVPMACVIHPPVRPDGYAYADRDAYRDRVRAIVASGLEAPLNPMAEGAEDAGAASGPATTG